MSKKTNGNGKHAKKPQGASSAATSSSARKKAEGAGVSMPVRIVLIVFIVLMALSMMLPSLTYLVSGSNAGSGSQSQDTASDSSDSSSSTDSSDDTSADAIDARYQALVDEQQAKLDSDPENLAALLNMGNDYMQWGYTLLSNASTDDETTHAYDVLNQAIATFDRYLALNDSSAVKVNRALCQYYAGDTDGAIQTLQALTESDSGYGPAWANLGMLYQVKGDTDSAKNAYNKAIAVEPDDEYGSKTFAEQQLASIASSESSSSGTTADSTSSSSSSSSLADDLSTSSGTGL